MEYFNDLIWMTPEVLATSRSKAMVRREGISSAEFSRKEATQEKLLTSSY